MPRHLFIVSSETPYLADYMREQFRDEPGVEIIVDRRQAERRAEGGPIATAAGMRERRERQDVEQQLRVSFHAFVTVP